MVVLVTCKNEEDPIKNEGARVLQNIIHRFLRLSWADNSRVSGEIWPKFKLFQAFMHVLVTCKNENPIKNEGASVDNFFSIIILWEFLDAQGQLTSQSLVESGQISNSSKILCLFSLSVTMRKVQSK